MRTLEENEAIIERGLKSFVEMGQALKEIRDNKQYEKKYGTGVGWASYLKQRWDMTTDFALKLIEASEVVSQLKINTIVSILPDKESQVRELRKAPEKDQPKIWNQAVEKAKSAGREQPTAKEVKEEVSKVVKFPALKEEAEKQKKQRKEEMFNKYMKELATLQDVKQNFEELWNGFLKFWGQRFPSDLIIETALEVIKIDMSKKIERKAS